MESARKADPEAFRKMVTATEREFPTSGKNRFASTPIEVRLVGMHLVFHGLGGWILDAAGLGIWKTMGIGERHTKASRRASIG